MAESLVLVIPESLQGIQLIQSHEGKFESQIHLTR